MSTTTAPHISEATIGNGLTYDQICNRDFWKAELPGLHMEQPIKQSYTQPQQDWDRLSNRMAKDGYFPESDKVLKTHAPSLADAVKHCVSLGLPPVFMFVFDEAWECFHRLKPVLSHVLGENYRLLPDFWAWHVDPTKAQSGWKQHRDKGHWSLDAEKKPYSLTVWVPLTEANTLNSCMYMVPAHLDPTYGTERDQEHIAPYSAIRALPAKPGDYLTWNQAVLHWGSPSSEFASAPRISMAMEFQRGNITPFNQPLLPPEPYPGFGLRLQLIAKQILQYQHMYGFKPDLCNLAQYILNNPSLRQ
ncbi:MAG: phytanoyl-CoA dioxygenase family protein [Rickettsiales bacterium]|nr:phytanoyl-CoA dioxygenase family protein [Rickettsiales bacterium]